MFFALSTQVQQAVQRGARNTGRAGAEGFPYGSVQIHHQHRAVSHCNSFPGNGGEDYTSVKCRKFCSTLPFCLGDKIQLNAKMQPSIPTCNSHHLRDRGGCFSPCPQGCFTKIQWSERQRKERTACDKNRPSCVAQKDNQRLKALGALVPQGL